MRRDAHPAPRAGEAFEPGERVPATGPGAPAPEAGCGSSGWARAVAERLIAWYRRTACDLPWRREQDGYRILVSEVMLQQTRVETVIPYYEAFLRAFPTPEALAAAPEDEVLKMWEGLGYYARARRLQAAAREIVARFGGRLPEREADLAALPGVGPYIAGAVLSIAMGRDVPAVDGNVVRVLSRLLCIEEDVTRAPVRRRIEAEARRLIPPGRAGELNQALMDLGRLVCVPGRPHCGACPLADLCAARAAGAAARLPVKAKKKAPPVVDVAVAVIERDGCVLVARRPPGGLLGGLWEFPGGEVPDGAGAGPGAGPNGGTGRLDRDRAFVRRFLPEALGVEVEPLDLFMQVRHAFTHKRWMLRAYRCRWRRGEPGEGAWDAWRWAAVPELGRLPFSVPHGKIASALRNSLL